MGSFALTCAFMLHKSTWEEPMAWQILVSEVDADGRVLRQRGSRQVFSSRGRAEHIAGELAAGYLGGQGFDPESNAWCVRDSGGHSFTIAVLDETPHSFSVPAPERTMDQLRAT
jgi:hypothetical protein